MVAFPQTEESTQTVEAEEQSAPQNDAEPAAEAAVSYTDDMTVDEIRARMTIEQAKALTVSFGPNKGWTLGQVQDRRPSSLNSMPLFPRMRQQRHQGGVLPAAGRAGTGKSWLT